MRALVQRVSRAEVVVAGESTGRIDEGLLILAGFAAEDADPELAWMAEKCARLRIFPDAEGKMNRSLLDIGGDALVVSQFTLYGDAAKGNRPSFSRAARPEEADRLYQRFVAMLAGVLGRAVATGRFGAHMEVALVNDGPVTIWLERERERERERSGGGRVGTGGGGAPMDPQRAPIDP